MVYDFRLQDQELSKQKARGCCFTVLIANVLLYICPYEKILNFPHTNLIIEVLS